MIGIGIIGLGTVGTGTYRILTEHKSLIKEKTGCQISVGQNGWIWVKGENTDNEIKARRAIEFVTEKVYVEGLTEKVEALLSK